VEFLILFFFGILLWVFIQSQPELKQDFLILLDHFQQSSITPVIFERMTSRLFETPGIAGSMFIYIAVLIPVVEELIKPVAIWLLMGRKLSPGDGFLLGAVSGAGYALFENLTIAAEAEIWTFVMISRLGTAAIHMLTTALVGWGIASARTENRYGRFAMAFVAAITLHGVWNGLNILTALVEFPPIQTNLGTYSLAFAGYAPAGLLILAFGALYGLMWANFRFQRAIMTQVILEK
jgi:RsiW-degrading membrane proteinase PrsW (M82 family)